MPFSSEIPPVVQGQLSSPLGLAQAGFRQHFCTHIFGSNEKLFLHSTYHFRI